MLSILTQLQDKQNLRKKINEDGFSLLEVIVALSIMAVGFVTVLQLFSGSIRSVNMSEQYLKATNLAKSKMNLLEINNYKTTKFEGTFAGEENYNWELEVSPYLTTLNSEENNIQLSEVLLRVLWSDANQHRNIELRTLKLNGTFYSSEDSFLIQSFSGGAGDLNQETPETQEEVSPEVTQNICGSITSTNGHISGASSTHISGN